jgi:hypothetical protein
VSGPSPGKRSEIALVLAKAASSCKAVGDYPFGYTAVGKGTRPDASPLEAEQKAVAHIVELRSAGRSYREIAAALDEGGTNPVEPRRGRLRQYAT